MEGEIVTLQEIFHYAQTGVNDEGKVLGEFLDSGVQPSCMKRFAEYGIQYDASRPQRARAAPLGMVTRTPA